MGRIVLLVTLLGLLSIASALDWESLEAATTFDSYEYYNRNVRQDDEGDQIIAYIDCSECPLTAGLEWPPSNNCKITVALFGSNSTDVPDANIRLRAVDVACGDQIILDYNAGTLEDLDAVSGLPFTNQTLGEYTGVLIRPEVRTGKRCLNGVDEASQDIKIEAYLASSDEDLPNEYVDNAVNSFCTGKLPLPANTDVFDYPLQFQAEIGSFALEIPGQPRFLSLDLLYAAENQDEVAFLGTISQTDFTHGSIAGKGKICAVWVGGPNADVQYPVGGIDEGIYSVDCLYKQIDLDVMNSVGGEGKSWEIIIDLTEGMTNNTQCEVAALSFVVITNQNTYIRAAGTPLYLLTGGEISIIEFEQTAKVGDFMEGIFTIKDECGHPFSPGDGSVTIEATVGKCRGKIDPGKYVTGDFYRYSTDLTQGNVPGQYFFSCEDAILGKNSAGEECIRFTDAGSNIFSVDMFKFPFLLPFVVRGNCIGIEPGKTIETSLDVKCPIGVEFFSTRVVSTYTVESGGMVTFSGQGNALCSSTSELKPGKNEVITECVINCRSATRSVLQEGPSAKLLFQGVTSAGVAPFESQPVSTAPAVVARPGNIGHVFNFRNLLSVRS